ncbi:MAG: hypothetical protein U0231_12380 [Nitrospiraceae bacterium]
MQDHPERQVANTRHSGVPSFKDEVIHAAEGGIHDDDGGNHRIEPSAGDLAPQTFEDLMAHSGLSASQVLLAVDRLSRAGTVVLSKTGLDYFVTLRGTT